MSRIAKTVTQLADEAGIDADEALLLLWDAGIDANTPDDVVAKRTMSMARRALSLPRARDLRSVNFLAGLTGIEVEDAIQRLSDAGVVVIEHDRLPKGSVSKARKVLGISGLSILSDPTSEGPIAAPEVIAYFDLPIVGPEELVKCLDAEEIERIHWALVEDFANSRDPIFPPGARDFTLLGSAAFRPQTSLGDQFKYPTVALAVGAFFHSIAMNHAFFNGNKRTALVAALVMLERNNYMLEIENEHELFRFVLRIAKHDLVKVSNSSDKADREVYEISKWLCDRMRPTRNEEYPMKFHELRKILAKYGCKFRTLSGSRIVVTRDVPQNRPILRKTRQLRSHISYGGEGRDLQRNTIHKIRRDLWLDEEHGCDSSIFYGGRPGVPEFIARYRQTLNRLARL